MEGRAKVSALALHCRRLQQSREALIWARNRHTSGIPYIVGSKCESDTYNNILWRLFEQNALINKSISVMVRHGTPVSTVHLEKRDMAGRGVNGIIVAGQCRVGAVRHGNNGAIACPLSRLWRISGRRNQALRINARCVS